MPYAVSFCVRIPRNAPGRKGASRSRTVLGLLGGRVFRNPIAPIWSSGCVYTTKMLRDREIFDHRHVLHVGHATVALLCRRNDV
jgi:hypothetical protein